MGLFSEHARFWGCNIFYLLGTYPVKSIFPVVVFIYNIYVFNETLFPLSNCCYDNRKNTFFLFTCQPLLRKQFFSSKSIQTNPQKLEKKHYSGKIIAKVLLLGHCEGPRSKCSKCNFIYSWFDLICFTCYVFLKFTWMPL